MTMKKLEWLLMKSTTVCVMAFLILVVTPYSLFPSQRGMILLYVVPTLMYLLGTGVLEFRLTTKPKHYAGLLATVTGYFSIASTLAS